jgi:hypothetical protein
VGLKKKWMLKIQNQSGRQKKTLTGLAMTEKPCI